MSNTTYIVNRRTGEISEMTRREVLDRLLLPSELDWRSLKVIEAIDVAGWIDFNTREGAEDWVVENLINDEE